MSKNMAVVIDGAVDNIIWCNDCTEESEILKEVHNEKVQIGDSYDNGKYYRNGVEVLSVVE